jgi:hypothetical protein
MRLNKYDKQAFVAAALDDVPLEDFDAQAQKLWNETVKAGLPVDLLNTITKYPNWFSVSYIDMPGTLSNFATVFKEAGDSRNQWQSKFPELFAQIKDLEAKKRTQSATLERLRQQLEGAIGQCSTLKQAVSLLPEFVKYLPQDRDGDKQCRQMPVVANLVTDLINAGWPKK